MPNGAAGRSELGSRAGAGGQWASMGGSVEQWAAGREAHLRVVRMAALAVVLWFAAHQEPPGLSGRHLVAAIAEALAAAGWLGWLAARGLRWSEATGLAAVALMGGAGGVLGALAPIALTFPAVAALTSGRTFQAGPALAVAVSGAVATVVAGFAAGQSAGFALEALLAIGTGLALGVSWRQNVKRAEQAEALLAQQQRADAEQARAATLAERNRIGQEVHDVLAHSLGALAVQLAAADALMGKGQDPDKARELVQRSRALAVEGLEETRRAVQALREDPVPLAEQVRNLAELDDAELSVTGSPRSLPPAAGLAVYRAAQEAVTNARKHAPGAPVRISLEFASGSTLLVVSNGRAGRRPGALAVSGGGYGLSGMKERVEKAGGSFQAGPVDDGFRVEVSVPA